MDATDQKDLLEQFEDSDFAPALTLRVKDTARADAIAAILNAACKSQGRLVRARVRVSEAATPESS